MEYLILAARVSVKIARDEGKAIAGGDGMKGKKKRGMKLGARDTIKEQADGAGVRIQGVNVSAWVWANTGTAPHAIRRRKRGKKRKMTVAHPGTAGRGHWDRVAGRIEKTVPAIFDRQLDEVLRRG